MADSGSRIDGASDHGTHEAVYLPDPDGIGIELAADRPRAQWPDVRGGDLFTGGPQPLDVGALFATSFVWLSRMSRPSAPERFLGATREEVTS